MIRAGLRHLLPLLLLPSAAGFGQMAPSVTNITSSGTTLQLPGTLKITATVAPQQVPIGVPSGNVQFFNNASQPLGMAPLKVIPATQKFELPPIQANFGNEPIGVFTFPSGTSNYSILGMLDQGPVSPASGITYPQLSIYSGQGERIFLSPALYLLTNSGIQTSGNTDAFAIGDFNHDGILDVLIHGFSTAEANFGNEYYLLPGKAGGVFDINTSVISHDNSGLSCQCDNPTEAMSVDDFNGDGYTDVAYTANGPGSNGRVGVALNAGATAPGSFITFVTAPGIPPTVGGEGFHSAAITTGHFTSSGYPDIAVAGSPSTGAAGYVALYPNLGPSKGTISFGIPTLFTVGFQPNAIAAADFRKNGMTDVVVTNFVTATETGSVQVLFGDGNGHLTSSSTVAIGVELDSLSISDMNNDGFPDIVATGTDGSLNLLLNDGTGHFAAAIPISGASAASLSTIGDFNGDGLADVAELTKFPPTDGATVSAASVYVNSAASQATLVTTEGSLAAGTDTLNAVYAGDVNFIASESTGLPVTVVRTTATLTWPQPAEVEYGSALGATQLNAAPSVPGTVTYSPAAGTFLPPGATVVTATFVPADKFDYVGATATRTVTVAAPSLTAITPSTGKLGDGNTTITVNGQGLVKGAVVKWDNIALATTWVSLNQLTAVIPASLLAAAGTGTVTVVDPDKIAVSGSQVFTVIAKQAGATVKVPTTVEAGEGATLTLTVNPYPAPITATITLEFTSEPPNTIQDPAVLFPNNTKTETIQIPANSTAPIPAIDFSTGSTAGTITVTFKLTAGGVDVTPANLAPIAVTVPTAPPVINSVTIDRMGDTISIAIIGLSSTRDMTQAAFHFTPAAGASLKTTDLTVDLTSAFTTWYQSATSDGFGTTFLYTQPFTLTSEATKVGSVTVILTNSKGASQTVTAQ